MSRFRFFGGEVVIAESPSTCQPLLKEFLRNPVCSVCDSAWYAQYAAYSLVAWEALDASNSLDVLV